MPRSAAGAQDRWQYLTEEDRQHIAAILDPHSGMLERWRDMAHQVNSYGRITEPQRNLLARLGISAANTTQRWHRMNEEQRREREMAQRRAEQREREAQERRQAQEQRRAFECEAAAARRQAEEAQRQQEREHERQRRERAEANPRNNWRITLGVSEEATFDEVKVAFRKLVLLHHPDRGGDPGMMMELNTAYARAQRAFEQR